MSSSAGSRRLALVEQALRTRRLTAPAQQANTARNAHADRDRARRWQSARDALWELLDPVLEQGARVALLGAGNADDLPLTRLAARAGTIALIDLDVRAMQRARRREPRTLRRRIEVREHDVTAGRADAICSATARQVAVAIDVGPLPILPGAPYDVVVGDLLYSQLLYPALVDLDVEATLTAETVARHAPRLTRQVVQAMHASSPHGVVIHIHDPVAWWPHHTQPFTLTRVLELAEGDTDAALRLAQTGSGPRASDPRTALLELGLQAVDTRLWRWPFAAGVDYLACATRSDGRSQDADRVHVTGAPADERGSGSSSRTNGRTRHRSHRPGGDARR